MSGGRDVRFPLKRVVLLKPPREANTNALWRLNKCVYGLTDASRRWYVRVDAVFKSLGMECIILDEAVYIWWYQNRELCVCMSTISFVLVMIRSKHRLLPRFVISSASAPRMMDHSNIWVHR